MPVDSVRVGGLGLIRQTIERFPDDVEIPAAAGEV